MNLTMDASAIQTDIRDAILTELAAIERAESVRILYACESGSRGWGFASPDSDYDVRFLYVHPLHWYLRVTPGRDVIERPISGALDINGWELRKALGLLKKGNATLIEWLDSPIVYRADPEFHAAVRDAACRLHRPERSFHHYLHMARGNYREFLCKDRVRLKKYLYVLRPLLAALWVEQERGPAPMRFATLVATLVTDRELRAVIDRLLARKQAASEGETGPPVPALNAWIDRELTRLSATLPPAAPPLDAGELDRLLLKTVLAGRPDLPARGDILAA